MQILDLESLTITREDVMREASIVREYPPYVTPRIDTICRRAILLGQELLCVEDGWGRDCVCGRKTIDTDL